MARIGNKSLLKGVSGKIGGLVVRQTSNGPVLAKAPSKSKKSKEPSVAQVQVRERFTAAGAYAQKQLKNPAMSLLYRAGVGKKYYSAHHVAATDFLTPPKIAGVFAADYTGLPKQSIKVHATDDFRVASVSVVIAKEGEIIEKGLAVPVTIENDEWTYRTRHENKLWKDCTVTVQVRDFAGNTVSETVKM